MSILVVDDEADLRELYELTLAREGYSVDTAESVEAAWRLMQHTRYELLITDMRLPDGSGLDLIHKLEQAGRREKVLVITAYGSAENAVDALKAGAFDYLTKPVDLRRFRQVVGSALGGASPLLRAGGSKPVGLVDPDASISSINRLVGRSTAMEAIRDIVRRVARTMAPVLVRGESGTGKELIARSIHDGSPRAGGPFVPVNCGAIPETLIEAEFFGYRKGAFTGADQDRPGLFQAAEGGTLFLDELGDLPLAMQAKLLRAVQERAVRPLGSPQEVATNVRIVSATHRDLSQLVREGLFRQDLFFRLNVIEVMLPPLRERRDDLAEIAQVLLARMATEGGFHPATLSAAAVSALQALPLPGNVRELDNLLTRAVALSGGGMIEPDDLVPSQAVPSVPSASPPMAVPAQLPEEPPPPGHLGPRETSVSQGTEYALPTDLQAHLDAVERSVLLEALRSHRFNRTAAAAALGMSLRQMRYRLARLGVDVAEHKQRRAPPDAH
jgi:two-component system, NtrC family, response regulator PilR